MPMKMKSSGATLVARVGNQHHRLQSPVVMRRAAMSQMPPALPGSRILQLQARRASGKEERGKGAHEVRMVYAELVSLRKADGVAAPKGYGKRRSCLASRAAQEAAQRHGDRSCTSI